MVPQINVRWGTSMRPCHLPFPRSHLPESLQAASRGTGAWLSALLLGFCLPQRQVDAAPWTGRDRRQQRPVKVPPDRVWPSLSSTPLLSSACFLGSSRVTKCHTDIEGRYWTQRLWKYRQSPTVPRTVKCGGEPVLGESGFTCINVRKH